MPELPDVELFRRHLDTSCHGRTILSATVADPKLLSGIDAAQLARRLAGTRIGASRRHGKHLFVAVGDAGWLGLHFGMNGSLLHLAPGDADPSYDRVRIDFADGHGLAYLNPRRIGEVVLVDDPDAFAAAERLGPDALDPKFERADFERRLAGTRRELKALLMDQAAVAGIGNIYSDEILFQARLHPSRRSDRLDAAERRHLWEQMRAVLETAVAAGAGAERLTERLPSRCLIPQRKRDGRCPRCGAAIAAAKFGGRTGYFCPRCQPQGG
jgi:formamidopyrimidine-DNA glycosylase